MSGTVVFQMISNVKEYSLDTISPFVYISAAIYWYMYLQVNFLGPENIVSDISSLRPIYIKIRRSPGSSVC